MVLLTNVSPALSSSPCSTCSADEASPEPGEMLIQHKHAMASVVMPGDVNQSAFFKEEVQAEPPLSEAGWQEVSELCCVHATVVFMIRVVEDLGMEVCNEGCHAGFVPFFHCMPGTTYANLTAHITQKA